MLPLGQTTMQTLFKQDSKAKAREEFRRPHVNQAPFSYDCTPLPQKGYSRWLRQANAASNKVLRYALEQTQQVVRRVSVDYPVTGSNMVEQVHYTTSDSEVEDGRIWINQTQYFEGISIAAWNYSLGGWKLCQKWLQDRQGRILSEHDIQHYQQLLTILKDVVELMLGVDARFQERQLQNCVASS